MHNVQPFSQFLSAALLSDCYLSSALWGRSLFGIFVYSIFTCLVMFFKALFVRTKRVVTRENVERWTPAVVLAFTPSTGACSISLDYFHLEFFHFSKLFWGFPFNLQGELCRCVIKLSSLSVSFGKPMIMKSIQNVLADHDHQLTYRDKMLCKIRSRTRGIVPPRNFPNK